MENAVLTFGEFKQQIEKIFNQSLTTNAEIASYDFWQKWSELYSGIKDGSINILVDPLFAKQRYQEFSKYYAWKGFRTLLLFFGK